MNNFVLTGVRWKISVKNQILAKSAFYSRDFQTNKNNQNQKICGHPCPCGAQPKKQTKKWAWQPRQLSHTHFFNCHVTTTTQHFLWSYLPQKCSLHQKTDLNICSSKITTDTLRLFEMNTNSKLLSEYRYFMATLLLHQLKKSLIEDTAWHILGSQKLFVLLQKK